jgi:hypothetical protein
MVIEAVGSANHIVDGCPPASIVQYMYISYNEYKCCPSKINPRSERYRHMPSPIARERKTLEIVNT